MAQFFSIYRPYLIGLLLISAIIGTQIMLTPEQNKRKAECLVANDFHMVRFTFYRVQPDAGETLARGRDETPAVTQHCQHAPGLGQHFISVDLMQREQRGVPVSVSLMQDEGDGKFGNLKTIAPRQYEAGVLEIGKQTFDPGRYRLQLVFDGGILKDDTLNIPFVVMTQKEFAAL